MNRRLAWWMPCVVLGGLILATIGRWPMWNDETFTWAIARGDLAALQRGILHDVHPPLYFLLAWVAGRLPDQDEAWRLPSAVAALALVPLLRATFDRWFGRVAGSTVAWVTALAPVTLTFAVSARQYALLELLGAAVFAAGLSLARGPRPARAALALGLAATATLYTHYAGAAAVVGAGLGTFGAVAFDRALPDRGLRLGGLALALGGAGLAFAPWALGPMQAQVSGMGDVPIARSFVLLHFLSWSPTSGIDALGGVLIASLVVGLVTTLRRPDPRGVYLWGWVGAGLLVAWVFSASPRADRTRNFLDLWPAAMALAVLGLDAVRGWLARVVPAAVAATLTGPIPLALLACTSLFPVLVRRTSPETVCLDADLRVDSDVLDASIPSNAPVVFRPYFLSEYDRYAPGIRARTLPRDAPVPAGAWRVGGPAVAEVTDADPRCVFAYAFEWPVAAPAGPGCEALRYWIGAVAADLDLPSYHLELAAQARQAGDLGTAEVEATAAARTLRGQPTAWSVLSEVRLARGDAPGALEAADAGVAMVTGGRIGNATSALAWTERAKALDALGRPDEAKASREAATCAAGSPTPWRCGTIWEVLP